MKYNDQARLDPSQVGGGGRGGGGKIALGGGAGLVVLVIALLLGINPNDILGGATTTDPGTGSGQSSPFAQCTKGSDINTDRNCRFVAYTNSIQEYWGSTQPDYQTIQVQTFTGSIATGCGNASSAVGPFYCPADTTVYLDLAFFDQLTGDLGAKGGDAAEAYVLAHEFGHHIQQLKGTMAKVQGSGLQVTGPTSSGVRLELQADCYAGVWFNHATNDPDSPISEVTSADLADALDAASAVGDDRIQQKTQGQVTPETWTHGSAANRQKWLTTGFRSGDPKACDTFAAGAA
ncbi:neutral zinc metallopeptidase [uncultured Friedmanniella sp.]|uniref:KPN_02809 family neutral zinc metallopeptidase n=1 Tax=uncultured Friedmanniella sp. TaxID=335381 RepID=UPI0035CB31E3